MGEPLGPVFRQLFLDMLAEPHVEPVVATVLLRQAPLHTLPPLPEDCVVRKNDDGSLTASLLGLINTALVRLGEPKLVAHQDRDTKKLFDFTIGEA